MNIQILNNKTEKYYFKSEDRNQFLDEINETKNISIIFNKITPMISYIKNSFWLGPKDSCTPLHYDTDNFNLLCLLEGRKEIILIHPKYRDYLYEINYFIRGSSWSYVNIWNIDYIKFPLMKNIKYIKFILNPGEILYIPPYWWHAVRNLDNSIAFTYHYYTFYSFFTTDIPELLIEYFYK